MTPDGQNAGAASVAAAAPPAPGWSPPIKGSGKEGELTLKDHVDFYGVFRDYIKHEDTLIHHRITWLVTIQAFSVATIGILLQKWLEIRAKEPPASHLPPYDLGYYHLMMLALMAVGFVYAAMGAIAVHRAMGAIRKVKTLYGRACTRIGFDETLFPRLTDGEDPSASAQPREPEQSTASGGRHPSFWILFRQWVLRKPKAAGERRRLESVRGLTVYGYLPFFFALFWSSVFSITVYTYGPPWRDTRASVSSPANTSTPPVEQGAVQTPG